MNIYHVWCNLRAGVRDVEFVDTLHKYLAPLQAQGHMHSYRITRRKLGLGPPYLPEFHITLEFADLAQLDAAFSHVATRCDPVESLHQAVNSQVQDTLFALYRDFPDTGRVRGQEKF